MQSTRNITANINDPTFQNFKSWVLDQVVNPVLAFLTACAVAYFVYGIFMFFFSFRSGGDTKVFKSHVVYGLIGLVIIIGVWSILGLVGDITGSNIKLK